MCKICMQKTVKLWWTNYKELNLEIFHFHGWDSILSRCQGSFNEYPSILFCGSTNSSVYMERQKNSWHNITQYSILKNKVGGLALPYFQFSSVTQLCLTLCDPMNCSTPGLPVHHQLLESTQTHVHRVSDAIQPSHPLLSPSPPALNLSQHQGLFKWVSSPHQVAKVLEFQLQHQSLQWTARTDLL